MAPALTPAITSMGTPDRTMRRSTPRCAAPRRPPALRTTPMDWRFESRIDDVNRMTVARGTARNIAEAGILRATYIGRRFLVHTDVIAHPGASAYAREN